MRIVKTRRGARLVDDDVVLSEVLAEPGPTHALFDVLAAAVAAFAPGPRLAVLGFAAGGIVAPLRAMGFRHAVEAVDLDRAGERLFRSVSGPWVDPVRVDEADAVAWLRSPRARYHVIVEDLSVPTPAGTIKPYCSLDPLPALVRDRLAPGGVAVVNVLPLRGSSWANLLMRVALPHRCACAVTLDEYENRIVLAGAALPDARTVSRRLRAKLRGIGSNQAGRLAVRTLLRT